MNALTSFTVKTMSSVEIAELTGKRHDNVMRVASKLAKSGIIAAPQVEERYNKNNARMVYHLNKTESLNLVANLSPEFTARIIDRWQELEQQTQLPQTLPEALRLAADLAEQNAMLVSKTEAFERLTDETGAMSLRTAAKSVELSPKKFNETLYVWKWMTKDATSRNWIANRKPLQQGLLTVKQGIYNNKLRPQTLVTSKGLTRIKEKLQRESIH